MRAEYDLSGGVRGKYVDRYRRGADGMLIDPELADAFPDSKSVNDAFGRLSRSPPEPKLASAHVIAILGVTEGQPVAWHNGSPQVSTATGGAGMNGV